MMKTESSLTNALLKKIFKITVLTMFGGFVLFPFFFMVMTSLMPLEQVFENEKPAGLVPDSINWSNYAKAFGDGYWIALFNTALVTGISVASQIIISMMMGYGLAYKKFRFKKPIWYFLLALMTMPQIALIVGQYQMTIKLGLQTGFGTIIATVLPYAASVFSAFMYKNAFESIPNRTKEAALLDGVNEATYFWKIAVPIVSPTTWTVGILTAFAAWNSYMWPALLAAGNPEYRTILSLWLFDAGKIYDDTGAARGVAKNIRLAASVLVMLPLLIVYFSFRKRIMDAVAKRGTAIKG